MMAKNPAAKCAIMLTTSVIATLTGGLQHQVYELQETSLLFGLELTSRRQV